MRAIKWLIGIIVGIILLLAILIGVAMAIIDPNDYRPDIEKAVGDKTRLTLELAGDLGWSIIPIGININDVTTKTEDGAIFAELRTLQAQIDFWSLIAMSPKVGAVIIDGAKLNLKRDKTGNGNWENIARTASSSAPTPESAPEPATQAPASEAPATEKQGLDFAVAMVSVRDTAVTFIDEAADQAVELRDVNLTLSEIAPDSAAPLELSWKLDLQKPQLATEGSLAARVRFNNTFELFDLSGIDLQLEASGEPFKGNTINSRLQGDLVADLKAGKISVQQLVLQLANLTVNSDLEVNDYAGTPQITGNLDIPAFSARQLLTSLGQTAPATTDPQVLNAISLQTQLDGPAGVIQLSNLKLGLDDTKFDGKLAYGINDQSLFARLQGSQLNADRYLPPGEHAGTVAALQSAKAAAANAKTAPAGALSAAMDAGTAVKESTGKVTAKTEAPASPAQPADPDAPLLPVDTLKTLVMDVEVGLQQLIAKNLTIEDLKAKLDAKDGLIKLSTAEGKMYDGDFKAAGTIDVSKTPVTWKIKKQIKGIQTMPMLTDLASVKYLSGGINLDADITTKGNTVAALQDNVLGKAAFNFDQGALEGFNLTRLVCQGVSKINKDSVTRTDWPARTAFNSLQGLITLDGRTLNNNQLSAGMVGLNLAGKGTIDTATNNLSYLADLKIVGDLGDNACRINEKLYNLAIPVTCEGQPGVTPPAELCRLDEKRMDDLVKQFATQEVKRKADKKIDKLLDKHLGEDEESKKGIKGALDKLFK